MWDLCLSAFQIKNEHFWRLFSLSERKSWRKREISSFYWFIPQMATRIRAGADQSWELRPSPESPMCFEWPEHLGHFLPLWQVCSSHPCLPGLLGISPIRARSSDLCHALSLSLGVIRQLCPCEHLGAMISFPATCWVSVLEHQSLCYLQHHLPQTGFAFCTAVCQWATWEEALVTFLPPDPRCLATSHVRSMCIIAITQ